MNFIRNQTGTAVTVSNDINVTNTAAVANITINSSIKSGAIVTLSDGSKFQWDPTSVAPGSPTVIIPNDGTHPGAWLFVNTGSGGGGAASVTNIAALRTLLPIPVADTVINVECYSILGDNGGGLFYWDSSSTDSDDGGITILPTGYVLSGRWKRQNTTIINVKMFGAQADLTHKTTSISSGQNFFSASGLTSADIGKSIIFPGCGANDGNGHPLPLSGTITNVAGTTITVSFTAAQSASTKIISYGTNNTPMFQAAYNACINGQTLYIPLGIYGFLTEWGGTKAIRIKGDSRASTVLEWLSASSGNLLRLTGGGIYESSIEDLQFACQAYVTLDFCRINDPTYFLARQLTFSSLGEGLGLTAANQTNGLHFKNLLTSEVPPRGNIRVADILYTHETGSTNADGSHGIWFEGNASEIFQQVTLEGEMNLEQGEYGIRFDYVSNSVIKCAGLVQGNRVNIGVFNGDHVIIEGAVTCANSKQSISSATTYDIFIDSTCTNTQIYDPAATPAKVTVNDVSYMWVGTETRLTNIPSPTFRGSTTLTNANAVNYGNGGFSATEVGENTASDGFYYKRYNLNHGGQADRAYYLVDFVGNVQYHVGATRQFRVYDGLPDNNTPCANIGATGIQSSRRTAAGGVNARARVDAIADVDEIAIIAQAGSAQTLNIQEWQGSGGGAAASVTKDGYIGASPGSLSFPGFFFQSDSDTGFYRIAANSLGVVVGGASVINIDTSKITPTLPIIALKRTALTTPITIVNTDYIILVKLTSPGAVTINLPSSPIDGLVIKIKDATGDASTNNITVNRGGSTTIDGQTSYLISNNFDSIELVYDSASTNWSVM